MNRSSFFILTGITAITALTVFFLFTPGTPVHPRKVADYSIHTRVHVSPPAAAPALPDITGYTYDALLKRIPKPSATFHAALVPFGRESYTNEYMEDTHQDIFAKRQEKQKADVLFLREGVTTLDSLVKQINNPAVLERQGTIFTLKRPLAIGPKAVLIVGGDKTPITLRVDSVAATFIVNAGRLFFINATIIGWDSSKNAQHFFTTKDEFRPFLTSWHNAEMNIARSTFESLGYANSKSYGITYSTNFKKAESRVGQKPPTGWILESIFRDMYYGFYCFEAADIALIGNTYVDNIVYGIDPHDRSTRLIIARNEAYGTKKKHGIIISREVDDSWIFENNAHDNHGSGIMLDRSSVRNIVANNKSRDNGGDGLTIFESPSNTLWKNELTRNNRVGLRVRNAWDIHAYHNIITDNKQTGVQVYSARIESTNPHRDYKLDPYTNRAGLTLAGGKITGNKTSAFQILNADSLTIGPYEHKAGETMLGGDLLEKKNQLKGVVKNGETSIEIRIVPETKTNQSPQNEADDPS